MHTQDKFEYLFIDIEWNQMPGTTEIKYREPIQIGILGADESLSVKKVFSKAIRLSDPEHYNPDTLTLSHATYQSIMQANSEEVVLQKVIRSFPEFRYVVVWTKDTYELLRRGMKKYGIPMPRHRIVVFQEVLMHIASNGKNPIGFERALKQEKILYKKNFLHYSKHDANYMFQLFCKCYEDFQKWTGQEVCYLNKRSHIMHCADCRYITEKSGETWKEIAKDGIFQGNQVCKICGCEENWNRLQWGVTSGRKLVDSAAYMRELPLTMENMGLICNKFCLKYHIISDMVFIRTVFSRWIICIDDNNGVNQLRHENYRQSNSMAHKVHKKCMEGYHVQKLPSHNFYDVVSYIKYHDAGMLQRLSKKSRMEKMFDMIRECE